MTIEGDKKNEWSRWETINQFIGVTTTGISNDIHILKLFLATRPAQDYIQVNKKLLFTKPPGRNPDKCIGQHLARSHAGNVLAAIVLLTTGNLNVGPSPASASTLSTNNSSVLALGVNSVLALDVLEGEVGDGKTAGGATVEVTAVVVLLDEDTVLLDLGEGDVGVGDLVDLAGLVLEGLDAETVGGVGDLGVEELDVVNDVIVAATDRADRETVTTVAVTVLEDDVLEMLVIRLLDICVIFLPCQS